MRSVELSTASIGLGFDGSDMSIKKLLANPRDYDVKDKEEWKCPQVGDKIKILSFDNQYLINECLKVNQLECVTVKSVHPVLVGFGQQGYFWSYDVVIEEANLKFLQFHYKLI